MLCNAIHSNPDFLQVEHLDKYGQAQGTSKITYDSHLTLLSTTAFQLDLERLKCSRHHTEVNIVTMLLPIIITKPLAMVVKAVVEIMVIVVMAMIRSLTTIPITSCYLQNFGSPYQVLPNLLFPNITMY